MHVLWIMLQKQGAMNILMLRLDCCLPPPTRISGYAPGSVQFISKRPTICTLFFKVLSCFLFERRLIIFLITKVHGLLYLMTRNTELKTHNSEHESK